MFNCEKQLFPQSRRALNTSVNLEHSYIKKVKIFAFHQWLSRDDKKWLVCSNNTEHLINLHIHVSLILSAGNGVSSDKYSDILSLSMTMFTKHVQVVWIKLFLPEYLNRTNFFQAVVHIIIKNASCVRQQCEQVWSAETFYKSENKKNMEPRDGGVYSYCAVEVSLQILMRSKISFCLQWLLPSSMFVVRCLQRLHITCEQMSTKSDIKVALNCNMGHIAVKTEVALQKIRSVSDFEQHMKVAQIWFKKIWFAVFCCSHS